MKKKLISLFLVVWIIGGGNRLIVNAEDSVQAVSNYGLPTEYSLDVTLGDIQNSIMDYINANALDIQYGSDEYNTLMTSFLFDDLEITDVLSQYYGDYAAHYSNILAADDGTSFEGELTMSLGDIKAENEESANQIIEMYGTDFPVTYGKYDVARAQAYAKRYATSWNYVFGRFSSDCTNFASQIVNDGDVAMNNDWRWNGQGIALRNWRVAQDFTEYMSNIRGYNGGLWTTRAAVNKNANAGDCIAYMRRGTTEITHVAFVQSKVNGYIYLTQHTDDFYNVKFNDRVSESRMNKEYYIVVLDFTK